MAEEQVLAGELAVGDADVADVATGSGGADGLQHRLAGADGLDGRVSTEPFGEVLDPGRAFVAPLLDDVGGAVVEGQLLAGLVAAHDDDALGAELARRENPVEADGAVADDDDGLARTDLGGDGAEPAGAEDVGGGEEAGDQVGVGDLGGGDEGAVGEGDAGVLGLGADRSDGLAVNAGALVAGPADLTGVVRGEERSDDELAGPDRRHLGADRLDDAAVLVAHRRGPPSNSMPR